MNSSTGDFSEVKNIVPHYLRGTQSTAKKKPRLQRKVLAITPLNLDKIKKEVEEAEKYETISFNNKNNNGQETILKDISNKMDSAKDNINICKTPLGLSSSTSITSATTKNNDSFDLNFSALSLVTPMKRKDEFLPQDFVTPIVKVKTVANCPEKQIIKFDGRHHGLHNSTKNIYQSASKKPVISTIDETEERPKFSKKDNGDQYEKTGIRNFKEQCLLSNFRFDVLTVKNTEYVILNKLGQGGSSEVFEGFCPVTKRNVAIKCVSLSNSATASGYINEVQLLQKLQHCDRIIKLYDYEVLESERKLYVILEKGGEDLSTVLNNLAKQSSRIPLYILMFYWMEMLYAVKQIHTEGIIHSDLKPANFLTNMIGLKLIDFGIASSVQTDMTSVLKVAPEGSCNYISPEALSQESSSSGLSPTSVKYKVHFKSDVWSLGCILYQLVYRRTPFQHLRQLWKKLSYITNPNHVIEFPEANFVPLKIIETIKKCLQYDVKKRPSVDELIQEYETFSKSNI